MRTPEQLWKLGDEMEVESEDLKKIASSMEQWEAVQLLADVSRFLFSAGSVLYRHSEKHEVSKHA